MIDRRQTAIETIAKVSATLSADVAEACRRMRKVRRRFALVKWMKFHSWPHIRDPIYVEYGGRGLCWLWWMLVLEPISAPKP